jgi:hypothetical protein
MVLSLLAITAFIRLGKDSMRLYKVSTDIEFYAFRKRRFSRSGVFGSGSLYTLPESILQRFSLGERSGEFGGQFSM